MKLGLTLAGGGAKGAYQMGAIKALTELGYTFSIVTGTSVGALNGLLVVQQDFDKLEQLWSTITLADVIKYPVDFDFSIETMLSQANLMASFFKSYIDLKGADISPLVSTIRSLYDGDKAFTSPIDYGLVTIAFPTLIPQELQKKDMTKETMAEYAIASASCFPAFPLYTVGDQKYLDGGYYDNLPISLAMRMGAEHIVTVELQQTPIHEYFLDRPSITRIRPSRDLGNFLDFNRDTLDARIRQGYLDTYKTFRINKGHRYTFYNRDIPPFHQTEFYDHLLTLEDTINHVSTRIISDDTKPLTNYLLENSYTSSLQLEDYVLLALEALMEMYGYTFAIIHDYQYTAEIVYQQFIEEYNAYNIKTEIRSYSTKKFISLLEEKTDIEKTYYLYAMLLNTYTLDSKQIVILFPKAYIMALFAYTITKSKF